MGSCLEGPCQQMTIMWQASGEWWPIIEYVGRLSLTASQLFMECIDVVPQLQNSLLFLREAVISSLLHGFHYYDRVFSLQGNQCYLSCRMLSHANALGKLPNAVT